MIEKWKRFGVLALLLSLCATANPGLAAPWVQTTSLPDGYYLHSLVYENGYLYQTGGATPSNGFGDGYNVFYAQVHSDGTIGNWNTATPLPEPVFAHASVTANGFVYVLGGLHIFNETLALTNVVYYSKLNLNGSLGAWNIANPLPQIRDYLSASVWNKTIYVVGGYDGNNTEANTVYSAQIQTNGSLSDWVTRTPLPIGLYTQAEAANGMLYVLGGFDNGGQILNTVYYSKINADGTLGGWNQTTSLPQPKASFGAVAAAGRVFSVGGNNGSIPTSNCYVASVNSDGSLGSWSAATPLPHRLYLHAAAVSDSYIFVSGGNDDVDVFSTVYSMALPAPPAVPQFVSRSFTNGNFQLQLASSTNTGFGLLASTNLTAWTNIGWGFTGTNGTLTLTDTNAASFPKRFYRAYWPLP